MTATKQPGKISIAIAGLGNCASALIEGIHYYRQFPEKTGGLIFPVLCGYSVQDIEIVAAFDISAVKVGLSVEQAIYQPPNNFVRIKDVRVNAPASVIRGPTLDGNPEHLAKFVKESSTQPVNVASVLGELKADILINLLPTGKHPSHGVLCEGYAGSRMRLCKLHPHASRSTRGLSRNVLEPAAPAAGR